MNLKELRPLFARPIKGFDITTSSDIADAYLNLSYVEVYESHRWESRKRTGNLLVPPLYETGTCTVTKFDGTNSASAKTVTFVGSVLTGREGHYLQVQNSNNWHKIVYISGSTVYLDSEISDVDSAGGLTFKIWKRFCYVKSDADVLYDFNGVNYTNENYIGNNEVSDPSTFTPYGVDPLDDTDYSTGTVSGAVDTNVLVGTATSWLSSGFDTGDIVEVGEETFYIKRVESDTRIILTNYISEEIASMDYTLKKNGPIGIQFLNVPSDYKIIPYTYLAKAYPLIHPTKDRMNLSRRFIPAVVSRAVYYAMRDAQDDRQVAQLQIYVAELESLKDKVKVIDPKYGVFGSKIPSSMPGRG